MDLGQIPQEEVLSSSTSPDSSENHSFQSSTPGAKGKNKKYFQPIHTIPGESAPFVLPPGVSSCPIKSCPGYMRPCKPHWRLNEHMKLRHGWPRKNTQPNTDRRLAGKQRSMAYRKTNVAPMQNGKYKSKYVFHENDQEDEEVDKPGEVVISPILEYEPGRAPEKKEPKPKPKSKPKSKPEPKPEPHSARKSTRKRTSTQKAQEYDFELSPTPEPTSRPKHGSPSEHDREQAFMEGAPAPSEPPAALVPKADLDQVMIAEIRDYIDELRLNSSNMIEDPTTLTKTNPESMADGLQELLEKNPPLVNTCMPAVQSESITALYKALANRRNSKASIFRMAPSRYSDTVSHKLSLPGPSRNTSARLSTGFNAVNKSREAQASPGFQQIQDPSQWTHVNFGKSGTPSGSSSSRKSTPAKLVLKLGNRRGRRVVCN